MWYRRNDIDWIGPAIEHRRQLQARRTRARDMVRTSQHLLAWIEGIVEPPGYADVKRNQLLRQAAGIVHADRAEAELAGTPSPFTAEWRNA